MLTDQTIRPLPILGYGPEVFYNPTAPCHLNTELVVKFRRQVLNNAPPPFQFVFLSDIRTADGADARHHLEVLRSCGFPFLFSLFLESPQLDALNMTRMAALCDSVLSPNLALKVNLPCRVLQCTAEAWVETVAHFCREATPYTPEMFNQMLTHYGRY